MARDVGESTDGEPDGRSPTSTWPVVFMAFARIGATSFGGGSATVSAMRYMSIQRGWLTERQFVDNLVLSRLTPGISILAQVLLIGRRVAGTRGMAAAMAGMMLPSLAITLGLAWGYHEVSGYPRAQGPLHAVAGVAAGYAVALGIQLLRDLLRQGAPWRGFSLFLLFFAAAWWLANPLLVMGVAILAALLVPGIFDVGRDDDVETPAGPANDHES